MAMAARRRLSPIGGAQAPEPDTHLVQGLGLAGAHRRLIGDDLPEAAQSDGAERFARRHLGGDVDFHGPLGLERPILEELEAALSLGLHLQPERHRLGKDTRQAKQLLGLPALELELQFTNRARVGPGGDLASIDGDFDLGAVAADPVDGAPDARLEHRLQRGADLGRQQRLKRSPLRAVEIGHAPGNLPLPFEALEKLGLALGGLDGLHIAAADLANAEIDARLVKRAIGRVEIGGDELLLLGRDEACFERGMGGDLRGIGRI